MKKYIAKIKFNKGVNPDIAHYISIDETGDVIETHYKMGFMLRIFDPPKKWDKAILNEYELTPIEEVLDMNEQFEQLNKNVNAEFKKYTKKVDFTDQYEFYSDLPCVLVRNSLTDLPIDLYVMEYNNGICLGKKANSEEMQSFSVDSIVSFEDKLYLLTELEKIEKTYIVLIERSSAEFKIEADSEEEAQEIALSKMGTIYNTDADNYEFWIAE